MTPSLPIETDDRVPPATMYVIAPRRYRLEWRAHELYMILESLEEWAKRCSVITGIGE